LCSAHRVIRRVGRDFREYVKRKLTEARVAIAYTHLVFDRVIRVFCTSLSCWLAALPPLELVLVSGEAAGSTRVGYTICGTEKRREKVVSLRELQRAIIYMR
jgi:hypothetical protein